MHTASSANPPAPELAPVRSAVTTFRWPGPLAPLTLLVQHRALVWQMTRKEIVTRYRGSLLGITWSLVTPLLLLGVYTFVFGIVLEARWGARSADRTEFATILFAGLLVFWLFSECVTRAPTLVLSHSVYVKRMLFPLEVLPYVVLAGALFHFSVGLVVLLGAHALLFGALPATALLLPFVLLPLVVTTLGLCWFLASTGVFLRDINHVIGIVVNAALFLSPIFYPASAFPEAASWMLTANPIALTVVEARGVLLWGELPGWPALLAFGAIAWLVAWLGLAWFLKSRKAFADVV